MLLTLLAVSCTTVDHIEPAPVQPVEVAPVQLPALIPPPAPVPAVPLPANADVLALAVMCIGEINFPTDPEVAECKLMWAINRATALQRGITTAEQVRAYNSVHKRRRDGSFIVMTKRMQWVRALRLDLQQPDGWPGDQVNWSAVQPLWQNVINAATAFLISPGEHPCPTANHYGGDCADKRGACDAVPYCWRRVTCGTNYFQAYWRGIRCGNDSVLLTPRH